MGRAISSVKLSEEFLPVVSGLRVLLEHDAIDVSLGTTVDSKGGGVLEILSDSPIRVVGVLLSVKLLQLVLVEVESIGNEGSPAVSEFFLALVGSGGDPVKILPGKLSVVVLEASLLGVAQIVEVGNDLSHLVAVEVERKHKGGNLHVDQFTESLALNWGGLVLKVPPHVVGIARVWAKQIVENSDFNLSVWVEVLPARHTCANRHVVGSGSTQ